MVRRSFIRTVGVDPEEFDAGANLASIRVPVMIVHGEKDEVVPVWHAERLEAAVRGAGDAWCACRERVTARCSTTMPSARASRSFCTSSSLASGRGP